MGLHRGLGFLLSLLLLSSPAAQEPQDVEKEVGRQILLLNSDRIEERQGAMEALIRIGLPALPALREIVRNGPLEVRSRARGLVTRIEWGLSAAAPAELARIAETYENSDIQERVRILLTLAKNPDADYRAVFYRAWTALDDPKASVQVAEDLKKWNTALVEKILRRQARDGNAEILQALGEVLVVRGDFDGAADHFRRAYEKAPEKPLEKRWGDALFLAHRDRELAQAVSEGKFSGLEYARRVEALYRGDLREKARELLARATDRTHAELPYRYRDPQTALSVIEAVDGKPEEFRVLAHLGAKNFEDAQKAFRNLRELKSREHFAPLLLAARGDYGLLGSHFLREASSLDKESVKRHLRLARLLEGVDPVSAVIEKNKAHFLDPDLPDPPQGAAPGAGAWKEDLPVGAYHWLPATRPVWIEDAYYFMNREGHIVRSLNPAGGRPEWISKLPRRGRTFFRGWQFEWYNQAPQIAKWKDSLVVLMDRGRHIHSKEGTGGGGGMRLFLLDPETGEMRWDRSFPDLNSGRVFSEEGGVVFYSGGLALFDLTKKAWKWAVGGLTDEPMRVWAEGDFVYACTGLGSLMKLSADDGSLKWRRRYPSKRGGASYLERVGNRLIWSPDGSAFLSLSPESGKTEWESRLGLPGGGKYLREKDTVFSFASIPFGVTAISLNDGKILWERLISRRSAWGSWTLTPQGLAYADSKAFMLLDPESGDVRLARAWPEWNATSFGHGTTLYLFEDSLYLSGASAFEVQIELDDPYNPEMEAGLSRFVVRPALPPHKRTLLRDLAEKEKDGDSRVSLLETACSSSDALDPATWGDLARAYAASGDFASASWAVETELLLRPYSPDRLRTWQKRAQAWKDPTGKDRALKNLKTRLVQMLKPGETVEKLVAGVLPDKSLTYPERMIEDLLRHPSPKVRRNAAIAIGRSGDDDGFHVLLEALEKAEPDVAVRSAGALIRLFIDQRHHQACGWGNYEWMWKDELGKIRRASSRKEPEVRGALHALLYLLDPAAKGAYNEADLRSALESGDPILELAISAVLAKDGDRDARATIVKRIQHEREEVAHTAIWLAGWLHLEEAEKKVLESFKRAESRVLEALARIGTQTALSAFRAMDSFHFTEGKALVLGRRGTLEDFGELVTMVDNGRSFATARAGFWGLGKASRPEARKRLIEFGEEILEFSPERGFWRNAVVRALLAQERWEEAEKHLKILEAQWPPIAQMKDLRYRLLAGQGRDAGARRLRKEAEAGYLRQAELEPRRGSHLFKAGALFSKPKRLAEKEKVRKHVEEALRREPWNTRYREMLK